MPARKLPDGIQTQLERWLSDGATHQQIADYLTEQTGEPVTRIAVTQHIRRHMKGQQRKPVYSEWLPWTVLAKHSKHYAAVMLRAYARYLAAGKDHTALPPDLWKRLANWLALLEERREVVTYDPLTPEGFSYVPRRRGESIIRRPGGTRRAAIG